MASLRDPVAREKLASAFVPFAAGAAGGAAASIFVTKYGQGSLLVEVVTKGSEAEANLLQAYSSGKIKQDLLDNHWPKAGDHLTVELTSYKVIRASEEEFEEIRKEVEFLKDYHFQQNDVWQVDLCLFLSSNKFIINKQSHSSVAFVSAEALTIQINFTLIFDIILFYK